MERERGKYNKFVVWCSGAELVNYIQPYSAWSLGFDDKCEASLE